MELIIKPTLGSPGISLLPSSGMAWTLPDNFVVILWATILKYLWEIEF